MCKLEHSNPRWNVFQCFIRTTRAHITVLTVSSAGARVDVEQKKKENAQLQKANRSVSAMTYAIVVCLPRVATLQVITQVSTEQTKVYCLRYAFSFLSSLFLSYFPRNVSHCPRHSLEIRNFFSFVQIGSAADHRFYSFLFIYTLFFSLGLSLGIGAFKMSASDRRHMQVYVPQAIWRGNGEGGDRER